ncbi:MAG: O-antigen ligase family protein, partial [Solirubrobacterales bacterium]
VAPSRSIAAFDPAAIVSWLIPFALIVYLGMSRGGYGEPARGAAGAVIWWVIALGLLVYALPRARLERSAWVGLGIFAAFAAWTALGISWSESAGRSVTEVARDVMLLGVFALGLLTGGRERLRSTASAIAAGCFVIAAVALLSRLHPQWFPTDELSQELVGVQSRLRYPVLYWNALAGLIAIGMPLIVWAATSSRSLILRGLAAATVPTMTAVIFFTYSRAGAATAAIAVLVFFALSRRRLTLLAPIAVMGVMGGLVVWQASRRDALVDGLTNSTAHSQGTEMLAIVAVASVIAGVVVWALAQADTWRLLPRMPELPRRTALVATAVVAVIAVVAFIGLGGPGEASDKFEQFKQPSGLSDSSARLTSVGGNGRWQYWSSAVDAAESAPLTGIGPGTFQFWWNEHRDTSGLIRDAHSLFVETLGELGIVGLILIASFVLLVLVLGGVRAVRAAGYRRGELAALTAAAFAFSIAAGVDWLWELTVVPAAFLLIAAAILGSGSGSDEAATPDAVTALGANLGNAAPSRWRTYREPLARSFGAVLALGAVAVIAVPAMAAQDLSDSQAAFEDGNLETALAEATSAADLLPYAGAPRMQEAFVLEEAEEFAKAATAAREATERDSTNWEAWYLLSRIQAERGDKKGAALIALRRAQELNPLSELLNPVRCGAEGKICVPRALD